MFASISVTTFNRKKLSEFCIETIHKRTPRLGYELIVVDNGSTDGTVEMLEKKYKTSNIIDKLVLNQINNLGSAINIAWKAADSQAEWLITLSNDSFCMDGWLENFEFVVESKLKPDCIFCHFRMPDLLSRTRRKTSNGGFYNDTDEKTFYGAGLALRKKFVDKHKLSFLEGTKPWSTGRFSGSIYSRMAKMLEKLCLGPPVELGKPCVLTQDCGYADPEYEDYYRCVFGYPGRGGSLRLYSQIDKFESLRLRGGHTRHPDEYYKGSGYMIGKHYKKALNSQEGKAEWLRLEKMNIKV